MPTKPSEFESAFLERFTAYGLGGLTKRDTEVLVMYLLDTFGGGEFGKLNSLSNQEVSVKLKIPVSKVKQLRYEAGLKHGGDADSQARARLLVALSKAVLEPDAKKICLIIEDSLAKNWLQGNLKSSGLIFDYSFNSEIIKVDANGLFEVLGRFFDRDATDEFKEKYELLVAQENQVRVAQEFKKIASGFAVGAAKAAGFGVVGLVKHYAPGLI